MDGSGPTGFEDLTQALIATAQAATQAIQTATSTGSGTGASTGEPSGLLKKDLARLIPRPGIFQPTDREQEILQWRDWFWSMKQYLVVVDSAYQDELEKIEEKSGEEIEWSFLTEKEQERARFLYSLLGSLIHGRLVGLIKNVSHYNGFEALRQLILNCQPQARNRTMNLLQGIMAYPSFNMKLSILPQLLKLEEHFTQYERLGGKLPPDMRAAVLLKAISGPLKVHLNMTLNEGSSYGKIREAVLAYDTANTKWNESAALSFSSTSPMQSNLNDTNGPAPMEVDRFKGKDKGKGKTKDVKGAKGKGKEEKGKSKGKGGKAVFGPKSEGKGKGGKEKGKGKGSGQTCWTCGRPGHLAKDCWRVRQVEAPASNAPSSPPTVSPSTTTSIQPGSETTLKAVRRVSQPLIFDLRSYEESRGSIRMRMLREVEKPRKRAVVEFYNIATDDEEDYEGALKVNAIYEVPPEEEYQVDDDPTGGGDGMMATIIIDSGADASIFPGHMLKQGRKARGMSPYLQDAQGRAIRTYGHRDIDIELKAEDDRLVVLKERVTFSDVVSQPILSFGHLLRSGWSISGEERCLVNGEVKVPIDLQNQSLVVQGQSRNVALASFVRALEVTLGEGLKKIEMEQLGWKRHGERWIGVHRGQRFQNPQFIPDMKHQGEGMSRSTVVKKGDQWQLVEMSEPVDGLEDQEEEIEELRGEYMAKIITFVAHSTTSQSPEDLGFEVEGFDYEASKRRREAEDEYAIPVADDEGEVEAFEGREIEGPGGPGGADLGEI